MLKSVFAALIVGSLCLSTAHSHDFYAPECCSGRDCHPVDQTDLEELDHGCWRQISTGLKFCGTQVRPSEDRRWHVCNSGTIPYCVYIQNGS
jgi:hypothetical protein